MKRSLCFGVLLAASCGLAFGKAGMADSTYDAAVSVVAVMAVVAAVQLLCWLLLRLCKGRGVRWYKKRVVRLARLICRRERRRRLCTWALSAFVITPYLFFPLIGCITSVEWMQNLFFLYCLLPLAWVAYCLLVWVRKWREKCLTGVRALAVMLSVAVQQCIAYVVYACVCETSWFQAVFCFRYVENEYWSWEYFPSMEGLFCTGGAFCLLTFLLAYPFLIHALDELAG